MDVEQVLNQAVKGSINMTRQSVMGTVKMTKGAADMTLHSTRDAAGNIKDVSSRLVVDAFLIVPGKAGESKGEGQGYQQNLAPISIVSSCLVKEREIVASYQDSKLTFDCGIAGGEGSRDAIASMGLAVQNKIQSILSRGGDECSSMPPASSSLPSSRCIPANRSSSQPRADIFQGLHKMYARVLSCLLYPQTPGTPEELEMWVADDYKLVREWVARCGGVDKEAVTRDVTRDQHASTLQFFEDYDGKCSLMAGLLARQQNINSHPFYAPAAFATPQMFESWKLSELESIRRQKERLVHFNKTELVVRILAIRSTHRPQVETLVEAVVHPICAVKTANAKLFGLGKAALKKTVTTSKVYGPLMLHHPMTATYRATKDLLSTSMHLSLQTLMSPVTVTQALSRKRADIWCNISFGAYAHKSKLVADVTPAQEQVALEEELIWQVRPMEHGALCVELLRKRNFAVEIEEKAEELLGEFMVSWDQLCQCAQEATPLQGWFACDEGNFDGDGYPTASGREIYLDVQLVTKAIDGTEALPLFDPAEHLHRLYTDVYMLLSPQHALMPTSALDWLLAEVRAKCGVSIHWHHLLRLALGLNLDVAVADCPGGRREMKAIREGRLLALLAALRECDHPAASTSAPAASYAVAVGVRLALRFIQAQVRNGILTFPYKLAHGPSGDGSDCSDEEEYQEPVELRLLLQMDVALNEQLRAQEHRYVGVGGDMSIAHERMALHPCAHLETEEVVSQGLCRFIRVFYAFHLQTAVKKDKVNAKPSAKCTQVGWKLPEGKVGWKLPDGEVMGKHIKKVVKRSTVLVERLHRNFAHVLPREALRKAVEELVDLVTIDVLSLIAAYHLRGAAPNAFQSGSEEAMLLKLHLRANNLRHVVAQTQAEVPCDSLAAATCPVLLGWIAQTNQSMLCWIKEAASQDAWQPAAGPEVGGASSSLIDVFSAAEHACNTFFKVRMASQVALRLAFLDFLHNVCRTYISTVNEYARREHRQVEEKRARKHGRDKRRSAARGLQLGIMSFTAVHSLPFMDGMQGVKAAKAAKQQACGLKQHTRMNQPSAPPCSLSEQFDGVWSDGLCTVSSGTGTASTRTSSIVSSSSSPTSIFSNSTAASAPAKTWEEKGEHYLEHVLAKCATSSKVWGQRGEHCLEKLENMAESAVSMSAWKKGLGAMGRLSISAVTTKAIQVPTFGKVHQNATSDKGEHAVSSASASSSARNKSKSAATEAACNMLTSADFFDGEPLLSTTSCTRLSNIVNVKLQLDNLIALLESDDDFAGRPRLDLIKPAAAAAAGGTGSLAPLDMQVPSEWIQSEGYEKKINEIYKGVRTVSEEAMDVELQPLLQWLACTIAAALTDQAGSTDYAKTSALLDQYPGGIHLHVGQKVVRGPDWRWGEQGADEPSPAASQEKDSSAAASQGLVLDLKHNNSWATVQWANGFEETYRAGVEGKYDVIPADLPKAPEILPPALAALEDALEETLALVRKRVEARGFALVLRAIWLASVATLETCLVSDLTGNVKTVRRASDLLEHLKNYMHADGSGLAVSFMHRSSQALLDTIRASLSGP